MTVPILSRCWDTLRVSMLSSLLLCFNQPLYAWSETSQRFLSYQCLVGAACSGLALVGSDF